MAKLPIPEFEASARRHLDGLGFIRKGPVFVLPLDGDRFGWLGLSRGTEHGLLVVHPNVGVGHRLISGLVEAHDGSKATAASSPAPVVFAPLYQLIDPGKYRTWNFSPGEDLEACVGDLADAVSKVAIPFMRGIVTIDDFVAALRRGPSLDADYALPAALTLVGKLSEAADALKRGFIRRADKGGEPLERYIAFARSISPDVDLTKAPESGPLFDSSPIDFSQPKQGPAAADPGSKVW